MRKKLLCLLLISAMLCLAGCGGAGAPAPAGDGRLRIVATIFPEYDWIRNILGDRLNEFDLELLLDSGARVELYGRNNFVHELVGVFGAAVPVGDCIADGVSVLIDQDEIHGPGVNTDGLRYSAGFY